MNKDDRRHYATTLLVIREDYSKDELCIGKIIAVVEELIKMEPKLRRMYERECSFPLTDKEISGIRMYEQTVILFLRDNGLKGHVQQDPRGSAIVLDLPSGRSNTMGGGWCV